MLFYYDYRDKNGCFYPKNKYLHIQNSRRHISEETVLTFPVIEFYIAFETARLLPYQGSCHAPIQKEQVF